MRFFNLSWALSFLRVPRYRLAALLAISEATLSRKLSGRVEFLPHEKARIAEHLRFKPEWLFLEVSLPRDARLPIRPANPGAAPAGAA